MNTKPALRPSNIPPSVWFRAAILALLSLPVSAFAGAPFDDFENGTVISTQIPGVSFEGSPFISVENGNAALVAADNSAPHPQPLIMDMSPAVNRAQVTVVASKNSEVTFRGLAYDNKIGQWVVIDQTTQVIGLSGSAILRVATLFQSPFERLEVVFSGNQPEVLDKLSFGSSTPTWTGSANFDTLPNGNPLASGTIVTAQYPGLFVQNTARAQTVSGLVPDTQPNVLARIAVSESDTDPLRLRFDPPQGAVCLRAGYPASASDGYPLVVSMSAYAADGTTLLARKTKTYPALSAINDPIEIARYSQTDIAYVDVHFLNADGTTPKSLGGEEVLDTVQYGPVTPDLTADTHPPQISITAPLNNSSANTANSTQTHVTLALSATIQEPNGLGEVVLRILDAATGNVSQTHTLFASPSGAGNYTINPVQSVPIGNWRLRLEATDAAGNNGSSEILWNVVPLPPTVVTSIQPVPGSVYSRPVRTLGNSTLSAERPTVFLIQGRNFHPGMSVWLMPKNSQANEIYGPGGVNLGFYNLTSNSCRTFIPDDIVENWGADYEWVVKDHWERLGHSPEMRPVIAHYRGDRREGNWMFSPLMIGSAARWKLQRSHVKEGDGTFQLVFRTGDVSNGGHSEKLVLPQMFTPGPLTRLIFQSRIGVASAAQTFYVEVSTEANPTDFQWQQLWSRSGSSPTNNLTSELEFSEVNIPLADYAGRPLWIRFRLGWPWGSGFFGATTNPPSGWLIDDIIIGEQPTVTTFSSLSYAELHGFGFDNQGNSDMGWNSFLATYGDNLMLPFLPTLNPVRLLWYPVYYAITSNMNGHCAGLAQVQALSKEGGLFLDTPLPTYVLGSPGIYATDIRFSNSGAATYTGRGIFNQLRRPTNFWANVEVFQGGQVSSEFYEHMLNQMLGGGPNQTLATIRPHPPAYQLALFSLSDIGNAHVVTPYRVRDIPGTDLTEIDVYDSNWPFVQPGFVDRSDWNVRVNGKVVINRSTNTFTFNRDGSHPDFNDRITSGDDLYAIPNSLFRGGRTPPGVLDLLGLGTLFSFGSADSTVTDASGSQSAGWNAAGEFTTNFPDLHVLPVSDTTVKEGGIPQAAFLHRMQDATLKATVNVRGPDWIAGNLKNGNALYLEVDGATEGDTDQLTLGIVDGRARTLRYVPQTTGAEILPRAGLELSESEAFSAEWIGLQKRAGQGLEFEILRDTKAVSVENLGTDPQRSVLKITHGSAAAQGDVRYFGPLVTPPGARAALALSSWPAVGNATLLIDTTSDGTWDTNSPLRPLEAPADGFGAQDSNSNNIPDAIDIALGDLADINFDGIPDSVFRPAKLRIGAQNGLTALMHLEGQPGAQWKLQKTDNLAANDWAEIATGTLDSEGLASPSITRSTDSKVFYRAIVTMTEK